MELLSPLANEQLHGELIPIDKLVSLVSVMIAGGVNTTTALIGNALIYLDEHPEGRARLIDDPKYLITATNEFLRYYPRSSPRSHCDPRRRDLRYADASSTATSASPRPPLRASLRHPCWTTPRSCQAEWMEPGRYLHYKGGEYEVLGVASHSESLEHLVVYRALYGEHGLWVRPLEMFTEGVVVEGVIRPRFVRVTP